MSKQDAVKPSKGILGCWKGQLKEYAVLFGLAIVLIVVAWTVFREEDTDVTSIANMTDTEIKVARILQEIDGVGEANVIVCETKDGIESVVVICEGANDLRVVMNVREAVAAALGTTEKSVKIYLKKE